MIARLLAASLLRRPRQLLLIQLAVLVAASTCATVAGFVARGRARLESDLAAFGPNLLVRPQPTVRAPLPLDAAATARAIAGVALAAGVAERTGTVRAAAGGGLEVRAAEGGESLLLFADPALASLYPGWEISGRWPRPGEAALGAALRPDAGGDGGRSRVGTLATGERFDRAVLLPLADLDEFGAAGLDRVEVRADPRLLEAVAAALEASIPGAEARPLRRTSAAEAELSRRVAALLAAVGGVALVLAALAVAAAAAALLGERRAEIGLLVALGWSRRQVVGLMAGELLAAALLAALVGEIAGEAAAAGLVRRLLGTSAGAGFSAAGALAAGGAALAVVGVALAVVLRRLGRLEAATLLAGE